MANIKDKFSPEIIEGLTRAYSDQVKENVEQTEEEKGPDPMDTIKVPKYKANEGQVLFSDVFWKPKTIPDLPLPMFKDDDWHEEAQHYIPDADPNWVWNRPATEQFALAMFDGDTTLLHGLQGTGKSMLPQNWCALFRIPFWRMSCNRETREAHFLGSPGVDYNEEGQMRIKQEPTLLTDSLKYGGLFCEDEAFRHNSALVLQSLREKTNRSVLLPDAPGRTANERKLVAPKGVWWYVLTDNTCGSGDETGIFDAEVQDASTLDRIDTAIEVPYLGKPEERKILTNHSDLDLTIIDGMLDVAKQVRNEFKKENMMATMSVRALLSWANKAEKLGHVGLGLKVAWYNKLGTDDQKLVEDLYHKAFGRGIND